MEKRTARMRVVGGARPAAARTAHREARRRARRDTATRSAHRAERIGLWRYVFDGNLATLLTAPLIYSVLIPFVLLDIWVTIYQAVCFRAWDIRRVRRRDYIATDRHHLAYLNGIEKANCLYCSYANGLVAYVREVAARTEQYWCPIRHARRVRGIHDRYEAFAPYGDARAYRGRLAALRAAIRR
jgi:hypothetical protein